ncbi:MAG TPA: AMP-binding protein [Gemmataceae bacterium]|jgi:fatty-acyl-CoA synthase|nr:AMP-binding protein [Gemmataceae bacterium]
MAASTDCWVNGLTFAQVLARTADRFADQDALVFPQVGVKQNYRRFQLLVDEAALALIGLGVQPGDHVGLWATNYPQWVILQFATAQIRAVLVNINPAYRANELAYVLNQADITCLFLTDCFKGCSFPSVLAEVCPELAAGSLPSVACPALRHVISIKETKPPGMLSWSEFCRLATKASPAELQRRQAAAAPDDVVNIQYTSGTTGFPKGAMLTHRNLLLNACHAGRCLACTQEDRICIPVPFYHCFGCVLGTLLCVVHGAAMVIPAESFDPLATLEAIQSERCTAIYGVPTMFIAQLTHARFAEFDLRSLRTGIMAGSPCPIEVMRAVAERMGARDVTIAYGLTEASPVVTQTAASDDLEHRVSTVGKPLPGLEVRIAESGTTNPLPFGQSGELLVRGHCVMKGYYKKPAETAAAITPDGWLHTGDLALQTPDGSYRITGRIKDLIIRGGENVYPREIEEFLYTHPAIAEAQVVGLPDAKYGEEVSAWIRLKPGSQLTAEEVRRFCRERIAHFKVPRYVEFVLEYPTTVTGKIQKYRLREIGIERFDLHQAAQIKTA